MILLALLLGCGHPALPRPKNPCEPWKKPGTYQLTLRVGDLTRSAVVVVPKSKGPRDLVVALHGRKGSSGVMAKQSGYSELAQKEGFVVAYPQGVGWIRQTAWNAGTCCDSAMEDDVADVAFLDALVAELEKRTCTDRVLAAGFSNGSAMVQRWACESEVPDAVVAVGAPLIFEGPCTTDPVPLRVYQGTNDPIVPIEGRDDDELVLPPARQAFKRWRSHNRCRAKGQDTTDGKLTCQRWPCSESTEFCVIDGFNHRWPGGPTKDAGFDVSVESLELLP